MQGLRLVRGGLASSPKLDSSKVALIELVEENKMLREQFASLVLDLASLLKEQTPRESQSHVRYGTNC